MTKHHFSFQEVFKFSWAKTRQHAWFIVLTFIITSVLISAVKFVPLLDAVISLFIGLSIASISLRIVREEHFTFTDLVTPILSSKRVLKTVVLSLLYAISVAVASIFLLIPGIYVAVRFKFFPYLVIENENATLKELIKMSYKLTQGHFWPVFFFLVLVTILNILGAAFFLVGLVVTVPVSVFASAYMYIKLKEHAI